MKKIMKEWKKWLWETAPTHKDMPQIEKPEGAHGHDRALANYRRGEAENALKVGINNYIRSGDVIALKNFFQDLKLIEDPTVRPRIATALVAMHHIYKNKDDYDQGLKNQIPASRYYGSQTGFLFDDQPIIKTNPAKKIEPIVKMMGDTKIVKNYFKTGKLPPNTDLNAILSKFISQNAAVATASQEPVKQSRFASRAAGLSDFYKNFKR